MVWVIDVSHAATHACSEVPASLSEDNDTSAGHVFATMVACAFDDGNGSTVSHGKTLADLSVDIKLATRSAIKTRVAGDDVILGDKTAEHSGMRRHDADATSAQSFAKVVVGLTFEPQTQSLHGKRSKRLPGRALELDVDGSVRQSGLTILLGDDT